MSGESIVFEVGGRAARDGAAHDGAAGRALGLLECRTLARGVEAADLVVKEAPVTLHEARPVEPGRLVLVFSGTVDDVRQSARRGRAALADDLVDELVLAGPHAALLHALEAGDLLRGRGRVAASAPEGGRAALGLVECASVAATLLAADAALKEASVRLVALRLGPDMAGKGLVAFEGETSDVESAVSKAAAAAEARDKLVRAVVIPHASAGLLEGLG